MMQRDFQAEDLVSLPRFKALELLAVARALAAHGRASGAVSSAVTEALREVEAQTAALAQELSPAAPREGVSLREADLAECNAVGALVDLAAAWARLPEADFPAQVSTAQGTLDVMLEGAGREFLATRPLVKHSEVQRRLDTLKARGLDDALRALGAEPFLKHLARTHKVYGQASGATAAPSSVEAPAVRATAATLASAVKCYVVRVVGTIDRKRPETAARADALLHPLRTWSAPDRGAADDATAQPAAPVVVTPATPVAHDPSAAPANDTTAVALRPTG